MFSSFYYLFLLIVTFNPMSASVTILFLSFMCCIITVLVVGPLILVILESLNVLCLDKRHTPTGLVGQQ